MNKMNANYILLEFVHHIYWVNDFLSSHPKFKLNKPSIMQTYLSTLLYKWIQ